MPKLKMNVDRVVDGKPRKKGKPYDIADPYFSMVKNAGWGDPVKPTKDETLEPSITDTDKEDSK